MPNFHDLPIGDGFPALVNVVIEIPRGARTKYEYDAQLGLFRLDRVLYAAVHYPTAYGFIPRTLWDNGDPLDILLVLHEALFPECLVEARPLALLQMQDEKGLDDKVFSVAVGGPVYAAAQSLQDLPPHIPCEIEQQLERLRAAVAVHPDWQLAEEHTYRDDGYSGTRLNRPGLDWLWDHAAFAAFELVLITAPDRLALSYVHQVVLIDELANHSCNVMFLDRPMSADPHDQLLLHIRSAVAEYERVLISDRMRRGRQAKLRHGQLLPWTVPPYGYILDPERPRDPHAVRLDLVQAAIVAQIFAWFTDPVQPATLQWVATQLTAQGVPAPRGGRWWRRSSIRAIWRDTADIGTAYSGRTRTVHSQRRKSPLQLLGPGYRQQLAPHEGWIAIPVPGIVDHATFEVVQVRLEHNKQRARRHNTTHSYLLRSLVRCGHCHRACQGRTDHLRYSYYTISAAAESSAGRQALPEAGATYWGSDKARSQQARLLIAPVEHRTYGRVGRQRVASLGTFPPPPSEPRVSLSISRGSPVICAVICAL